MFYSIERHETSWWMSRYVQPSYGFRKQSEIQAISLIWCTYRSQNYVTNRGIFHPPDQSLQVVRVNPLLFFLERLSATTNPALFHSTIIRDSDVVPTPRVSHSPIGSIHFSRSLPINKMMSNFLFPQHAPSTQSFCRRAFLEFKKLRFRKKVVRKSGAFHSLNED